MRASGRLTALQIQRLREPGRYADGARLYLRIARGGTKSWEFRFTRNGKSHHMGLGPIRLVGLAEARQKAAEADRMLFEGKDPLNERKGARAKTVTFNEAAGVLFTALRPGWRSASHAAMWKASVADLAFGETDVAAIGTAEVMRVLDPIWPKAPEAASRLRGRIEAVLDWARARGHRTGENPARWRGHLQALLPARKKVKRVQHHAALAYAEIGGFVAELRQRDGVSPRALEFLILTATRTGETLGARWDEISLGEKLWIIPASRTKASREHRVPLADRALDILAEMASIRDGADCIFPGSRRGRPLNRIAMLQVLKRMGRADLSVHGFRSAFRDWCGNETNFPREVCEHALAHKVGNEVERAYRRSDALEKRRRLMDAWANYCARPSGERGKVVSFGRA
jgi:integrase